MNREDRSDGIFREELPNQLVAVLKQQMLDSFTPIYHACTTKSDAGGVFERCMDAVVNKWTEADFDAEAVELCKRPRAEDAFRHSFIRYVKETYTDPVSQRATQIRLTVPLLSVFVRHWLRSACMQNYIRCGRFFHRDADVLQQDQVIKETIRGAFAACSNDYVIVEDVQEAEDAAAGAETHARGAADDDDDALVAPDDSASNISAPRTVARKRSPPSSPARRDDAKKAPPPRTGRSAITSFDLASTAVAAPASAARPGRHGDDDDDDDDGGGDPGEEEGDDDGGGSQSEHVGSEDGGDRGRRPEERGVARVAGY